MVKMPTIAVHPNQLITYYVNSGQSQDLIMTPVLMFRFYITTNMISLSLGQLFILPYTHKAVFVWHIYHIFLLKDLTV